MTLGEYLVQLLRNYDVDYVFGIPGVHTIELYRGLEGGSPTHVLPRHEQGAGFMADGYARVTGKPGVCFVITGPGLANIITPMGQAYADSIPMLVISGVNKRGALGHGHGYLHEMPDQKVMVEQVCEFSHTVQCAEELAGVLARAFAVFESSRPRPVHIEVPIDVMTLPVDVELLRDVRPPKAECPAPASNVLARVEQKIRDSHSPIVLLGGGCVQVSRQALVSALNKIGAPVVQTVNGRNCLDHHHPLSVPASPSLIAVREAINQSDLVLAFGTEFGRTDYDMFDIGMAAFASPLIRFDIDPKQLVSHQFAGRSTQDDILICCDVAQAFDWLSKGASIEPKQAGAERSQRIREAAREELSPRMKACVAFLERIRSIVPDAVIVGDSTQPVYGGNLYYAPSANGMWFNSSVGFGTLGYGLPAAIGARIGRPQQPVIALVGDGGLQFTLSEFGAISNDYPIITIIWNNDGYGEIESSMRAAGVEPIGVKMGAPDFKSIAAGYGLNYVQVSDLHTLDACLKDAVRENESVVICVDERDIFSSLGHESEQN